MSSFPIQETFNRSPANARDSLDSHRSLTPRADSGYETDGARVPAKREIRKRPQLRTRTDGAKLQDRDDATILNQQFQRRRRRKSAALRCKSNTRIQPLGFCPLNGSQQRLRAHHVVTDPLPRNHPSEATHQYSTSSHHPSQQSCSTASSSTRNLLFDSAFSHDTLVSCHPSSLSSPIPRGKFGSHHDQDTLEIYETVDQEDADPVARTTIIDWTSHATREREYKEIDRCCKGLRGLWRRLAPGWCQGQTPLTFYDETKDDDTRSVRRYRVELPKENEKTGQMEMVNKEVPLSRRVSGKRTTSWSCFGVEKPYCPR